jgi:hypothetical protein
MKESRGTLVFLTVLGGALTAGWLAEHGLFGPGTADESISEAVSADDELDRLLLLTDQRRDTLYGITANVITGRLGLLEAAAAFRAADAGLPSRVRVRLEGAFPGASDDERECRRVIRFVETAADVEPSWRTVVVGRLEAELQACLHSGTARLPAVPGWDRPALVESSDPVHAEVR